MEPESAITEPASPRPSRRYNATFYLWLPLLLHVPIALALPLAPAVLPGHPTQQVFRRHSSLQIRAAVAQSWRCYSARTRVREVPEWSPKAKTVEGSRRLVA